MRSAFLVLASALGALSLTVVGCESVDSAAPEADGTYYGELKAVIDAKCVGCHVEGGIAPFSLETYDEVRAMESAVRDAVATRRMPPAPAEPGCAEYSDDPAMTEDQIAKVVGWIDAGSPEGESDGKVARDDDRKGDELSRVDLTLSMPKAYTPSLSPDEYRCFLVDWPENDKRFVTGFRVNPGNTAIVHHVIAYLIPPSKVEKYDALDAEDAEPGYSCFGGPGGGIDLDTRFVASWAPGAQGGDLPAGTGLPIEPGSKIALQVHYNTTNDAPAPDQTSIDLKLEDKVEHEGTWQFFTKLDWVLGEGMELPAMTANITHDYAMDPTPLISNGGSFTIHEMGLHMHTRGKKARLAIERQSGNEECVLSIPKWDFHWQMTYELEKPKVFQPGDSLTISCTWDNDTPNELRWGEGTGDEMCLGLIYYTVD